LTGFKDEIGLYVLRRSHLTQEITQQALAREPDIDLGSNFCFLTLAGKD